MSSNAAPAPSPPVSRLLEIQAAYFDKIRAANAAGDAAAVQNLLMELDHQTRALSDAEAAPALAVVPPPPPSLYQQAAVAIDLEATVYDGDRDLHRIPLPSPPCGAWRN